MKTFISMANYNLKLLFRDMSSIMFAFLMPIGFYILFSNMLSGMPSGEASIQELLVPLYTIIVIGNAVLVVFGGYYSMARESGNLTKYKFLGVSELLFSASLFSAILIFQLLVLVCFFVFVKLFNGISFPFSQTGPVLVVLAVINVYQFAVSYFLNAVIRKTTLYNSVALTFYMFQMFLGGLTFPMEMFPEFLRKLVYFVNPIVYGRNALLEVWVYKSKLLEAAPEILILLGVSAGLILAGMLVNKAVLKGKTQKPVQKSVAC